MDRAARAAVTAARSRFRAYCGACPWKVPRSVNYCGHARRQCEVALRQRFVGTNQLQNLRSRLAGGYNVTMTDSPGNGTGGGGTCFGDSGGPIFHTDSTGQVWQVAVISYGTKYCHGSSAAFRLDNGQARAFLSSQGVPLN